MKRNLTPAELAARDQQLADSNQALALIVGAAKLMLSMGDDRADVIEHFTNATVAELQDGSATPFFVSRMVALAAVQLAEAGEPK